MITSHAACKGHAPENTLAGVRKALALRADAIEIDVQLTRDGVPVLLHDRTVERTTDGTGAVAELSLRQAQRLDAGGGERIPALRQVLRELAGKALLVIEIKPRGIEAEVLEAVRKAKALDWCAVHSFWPQTVERVRRLEPRMPCSLLVARGSVQDWDELLAFALSLHAQGVALHKDDASAELVGAAHRRELRCSTWTANERADVLRLSAAGADAITSDYPDKVRRWLRR